MLRAMRAVGGARTNFMRARTKVNHLTRVVTARLAGTDGDTPGAPASFLNPYRRVPSIASTCLHRVHRCSFTSRAPTLLARASAGEWDGETLGVLRHRTDALGTRVTDALDVVDLPRLAATVADLDATASEGSLWDDPAKAKAVMAELADAKEQLATARQFENLLGDAAVALEMIDAEKEEAG